MTTSINMHDFVAALRQRVPDTIHRTVVDDYLRSMQWAADAGDMDEFGRLHNLMMGKVVDELRWEAVKYSDKLVRDYKEAYRLRHQADRIEAKCNTRVRSYAFGPGVTPYPSTLSNNP